MRFFRGISRLGFTARLSTACRALLLLFSGLLVSFGSLFAGVTPTPKPLPKEIRRIVVKVKPSLAHELEANLDGTTIDIRQSSAQNTATQGFLIRHALPKMTPLHPNLIHLRRRHGWSEAQLADHLRQSHGTRTIRAKRSATIPAISRTYVIDLPDSSPADRQALLKRLQADPEVEFAEPDQVVTTCDLPNDPYLATTGTWGQAYADLWGHYAINAPAAWATANGSGVVVAVIDTGIDATHPDIAANIWTNVGEVAGHGVDDDHNGYVDDVHGWDFVGASYANPTPSNNPVDHHGHGTHVSGTIAATGNNALGIIGVAWGAKIMPLKALDDSGAGLESILVQAIRYAADNGADVINASWVGPGTSQAIEEAIQYAYGLGVVFVAGAGNNSDDASNYFPANAPEAITVAALSPANDGVGFSNYGSKIDVAAPGVDVLSLCASGTALGPIVGTQYVRLNGTSMAAPHVAGTVALLLSRTPSLPVEDVRQIIRGSAVDASTVGWSPHLGSGVLNAQAALAFTNPLQAHIASPVGGSHLNASVSVRGFAQGPGFDHYVLEYGSGTNPNTWISLQIGSAPVAGGALGNFNSEVLPDGIYTIRLQVFDTAGRIFSDRISVSVDYLSITSPVVPRVPCTAMVFKPGAIVPITGMATGASFQGYTIFWAKGFSPTATWNATGISLAGNGQSPVRDGLLGDWDTTGIGVADYYTIRVQVQNAGFTSQADTLVYLEPDLISQNWPQVINQSLGFDSGFVPLINPSGNSSLVLVTAMHFDYSKPGRLLRYTPEGTLQNSLVLQVGTYANPAVGDMDDSPGQEVVCSRDVDDISIFHLDDSVSATSFSDGFRNFHYSPMVLDDLEGDSRLGVVAAGFVLGVSDVFALRRDGTRLNANQSISFPNLNSDLGRAGAQRVLVGDINGDGKKELLVVKGPSATTYQLGLYGVDGTPIFWPAPENSGFVSDLVLADLDHNGKLEVVVVDSNLTVHVYQPDGTERPGWPQSVGSGGTARIAIGDLDRNGTEEIVVVSQERVFVFEADGTLYSSHWPLTNQVDRSLYISSYFDTALALADVDGDGFQEILILQQWIAGVSNPMLPASLSEHPIGEREGNPLRFVPEFSPDGRLGYRAENTPHDSYYGGYYYLQSKLLAYDRDGNVSRSWNLQGIPGAQPASFGVITVGDFDHNGKTDIAVTYPLIEGGDIGGLASQTAALVLATGAPYVAGANDWPMIHHDPRNSSILSRIQSAKNFRLSASTSSVGIALGQQSTLTLAITPINEFHDPVVLVCSGFPNGVTYSLSSASVTPPGTVATSTLTIQDAATLQPGTSFPITVTATSGGLVHTLTLALNVANFTLAVDPVGATVNPGGTRTFNCLLMPLNGFQGDVSLSCVSLPSGFQGTFSPSLAALTGSPVASTLTVTAPSTLPAVNPLVFSVLASGRGVSKNASVNLTVTDFSLGVSTSIPTITPNGSAVVFCSVAPINGFTGAVTLGCSGLPAGVQATFSPTSVAPQGGSVTSTLTIQDSSSLLPGTSIPITLTASSEGLTHSVSATLNVADFALQMDVTQGTVSAGGTRTFNCTLTPRNGYQDTVTLACTRLPAGFHYAFNPASVILNGSPATSTLTITAPSTVPATNPTAFTVTALGVGGGISQKTDLSLTVTDFSVAVTPTTPTMKAGGSTSATCSVIPISGFDGTVTLSCSGLPSGVQASFSPASVTPNGGPATSVMTLTASTSVAGMRADEGESPIPSSHSFGGLVWLALRDDKKRSNLWRKPWFLGAAMFLLLVIQASCGGGGSNNPPPPPPSKTYTITVTASAGALSHSENIILTVNP